ncbi:MAG: uncharacterized protein JWR19_3808 [Pedosphaera sp.]|nr:uncharacterized protein [Pedosphaera sp.]
MKTAKALLSFLMFVAFNLAGVVSGRAESSPTFKVGEFTFTRPSAWEWVEVSSPMRKAQLKVKDADGKESADIVFFQFGGGAGSTQANVDRWLGQFQEPRDKINAKVDETTVGKTKITYVQAEGTYKSGMPGGPLTPMPDYGLLGAIIQSDAGDVFVRMTGPKGLVKSSSTEFKKMIESGLKKE